MYNQYEQPRKPGNRWILWVCLGLGIAVIVGMAVIFVMLGNLNREKPHEHSWDPATCQKPQTCALCGESRGMPLEHDWEKATCLAPETCKNCGEQQGEPRAHNWTPATREEPKVCTVCGSTEGTAAEFVLGGLPMLRNSNETGSNSDVAIGTWIDDLGGEHPVSIKFWVMKMAGMSSVEDVVFDLEEKYEVMMLNLALCEDSKANSEVLFRFYLDDVEIYESQTIRNGDGVQTAQLDVTGGKRLRVECEGLTASSAYGIVEGWLSKGK